MAKPITLEQLLRWSETTDYWEEPALDFLADRRMEPVSHSRRLIIQQAWKAGWAPMGLTRTDIATAS
jgi:hypothetical protein